MALLNDTEQRAVEQVLHQEGFLTTLCLAEQDLIQTVKDDPTDLLVIDADHPNDLPSLCRILARYHDTRALQIILICPANPDRSRMEKLLAVGAFSLILRPLTYARLAETATQAVERSQTLRVELGLNPTRPASTTRYVPQNNSLLIHQAFCAFHEPPAPVDRYLLRAGKIETEITFFDLPLYTAPARGADFVDFNLLSVTVCPQCLFASNDPAHFIDPAEKSVEPVRWNTATATALAGREPFRRSLAKGLDANFFTHARTPNQALIATALAIDCAQTIFEHNKHTMPLEQLRLANHHLRAMQLHQTLKHDDALIEQSARSAYAHLRTAFTLLDGPALYKTIQQLVAVAIYLGQDKSAYQYITRLGDLSREGKIPPDDRPAFERCNAQCKSAWEDRDLHRGPMAHL